MLAVKPTLTLVLLNSLGVADVVKNHAFGDWPIDCLPSPPVSRLALIVHYFYAIAATPLGA
jgi:hypothetical protein